MRLEKLTGTGESGWLALPASSNNTLVRSSALKRFASAHPAEPAPTMMKSKVFTMEEIFGLEMVSYCDAVERRHNHVAGVVDVVSGDHERWYQSDHHGVGPAFPH